MWRLLTSLDVKTARPPVSYSYILPLRCDAKHVYDQRTDGEADKSSVPLELGDIIDVTDDM
jgi:hypothetical protein